MKSVERLHIDELKRVEKQSGAVLKAWRRLQKDFAALQEKYERLVLTHQQMIEAHQQSTTETALAHQAALSELETQWQARYDQERMQLEEKIELQAQEHLQILAEKEQDWRHQLDHVTAELQQEKTLKEAMVARIRGIEHE